MNKFFKLYLLFLACSVSFSSQSFFEKVDNSSNKLSLEETYSHDIKKTLDDGEISVSINVCAKPELFPKVFQILYGSYPENSIL